MQSEECPRCHGQGGVLISEVNDQYDHTWLQWGDCERCGGTGEVEIEIEEDDE